MDQKVGAVVPLLGELRPHLTQCGLGRGLHSYQVDVGFGQSGILIHPTIWPQYTNVTDRQTYRQDRTYRQRSDSIGQTVLQTVASKGRVNSTILPEMWEVQESRTGRLLPVAMRLFCCCFCFGRSPVQLRMSCGPISDHIRIHIDTNESVCVESSVRCFIAWTYRPMWLLWPSRCSSNVKQVRVRLQRIMIENVKVKRNSSGISPQSACRDD